MILRGMGSISLLAVALSSFASLWTITKTTLRFLTLARPSQSWDYQLHAVSFALLAKDYSCVNQIVASDLVSLPMHPSGRLRFTYQPQEPPEAYCPSKRTSSRRTSHS